MICRGGEGIAFGSLGQYGNMACIFLNPPTALAKRPTKSDFVSDVLVENLKVISPFLDIYCWCSTFY